MPMRRKEAASEMASASTLIILGCNAAVAIASVSPPSRTATKNCEHERGLGTSCLLGTSENSRGCTRVHSNQCPRPPKHAPAHQRLLALWPVMVLPEKLSATAVPSHRPRARGTEPSTQRRDIEASVFSGTPCHAAVALLIVPRRPSQERKSTKASAT